MIFSYFLIKTRKNTVKNKLNFSRPPGTDASESTATEKRISSVNRKKILKRTSKNLQIYVHFFTLLELRSTHTPVVQKISRHSEPSPKSRTTFPHGPIFSSDSLLFPENRSMRLMVLIVAPYVSKCNIP